MAVDARVFPWAAGLDADQLSRFVEDLWGAASGDDDLKTLDAIEKVIAAHRPQGPSFRCPLSKRQIGLLTQLANGATRESAARKLGLPAETVRSRCAAVYDRMGVQNATQAVAVAVSQGWLPDVQIPERVRVVRLRTVDKWRREHQKASAAMRAKPGTPVEIGPYTTRQGAHGAVWRIREGLIGEYRPAGAFDAEALRNEIGAWVVRAVFLGEPATTAPLLERTAS
ncbi:MAG TPA: LuxR C-terminal-related transcriptional regulator [Candidatus Dormibacteraeota bacterium]|jgi:DNA-binding CsgD family transcriptional regulator